MYADMIMQFGNCKRCGSSAFEYLKTFGTCYNCNFTTEDDPYDQGLHESGFAEAQRAVLAQTVKIEKHHRFSQSTSDSSAQTQQQIA